MGTRSLTKVIQTWEDKTGETHSRPITCMYRQHDGYPSGHGAELAEWLSKYTIVNGMPIEHSTVDKPQLMFNGMDCLAAQMFVHFKDGPGNIYCMHPDGYDIWEEYVYEIEEIDKQIFITVNEVPPRGYDGLLKIFHGTPEELLTKIQLDYA